MFIYLDWGGGRKQFYLKIWISQSSDYFKMIEKSTLFGFDSS